MKLKCECGSTQFYREDISYSIATYPPITVNFYRCAKCGKQHQVERRQEAIDKMVQEVEFNELLDSVITNE